MTFSGLSSPQDRDRAIFDLGLDRQPVATLAVKQTQPTQHRLALGNLDMHRAVVSHQDKLLDKIHRVELGVAATRAQTIHNELGKARLQVALARTGHAPRCQQRVSHDQARAQRLERIAIHATIVISQALQIEVFDQCIQTARHFGRPRQRIWQHRLADLVPALLGQLKRILDLINLDPHLRLGYRIDPLLQIVHLQHFYMCASLAVDHRKVRIHIEHAGISMT